jgi:membrane-associated protease RseP (regulator of RpoE activity)
VGRRGIVVTALFALSLAAGAGAWWQDRAGHAQIAVLERELAAEREAAADVTAERDALAAEVARLEAALAAAPAADPAAPIAPVPVAPPRGASAVAAVEAREAPDAPDPDTAPRQGLMGSFDPDRLVAAGFHRQDVERFRARLDEIELKRLHLRDRATRESWIETPRYLQESQALFGEMVGLRTEFDDALYDWVLYSTGHPNRVAVQGVVSGSAAESVGLQPGDVIVRYDDRLVLSAGELRDATTAGRSGELVAIEVQREGEMEARRVFVPRGPIGISLAPATQEPPPAG